MSKKQVIILFVIRFLNTIQKATSTNRDKQQHKKATQLKDKKLKIKITNINIQNKKIIFIYT